MDVHSAIFSSAKIIITRRRKKNNNNQDNNNNINSCFSFVFLSTQVLHLRHHLQLPYNTREVCWGGRQYIPAKVEGVFRAPIPLFFFLPHQTTYLTIPPPPTRKIRERLGREARVDFDSSSHPESSQATAGSVFGNLNHLGVTFQTSQSLKVHFEAPCSFP